MSDKSKVVKVGDSFQWGHGPVKVIAIDVSKRWCMVRRKGCAPFCVMAHELVKGERRHGGTSCV